MTRTHKPRSITARLAILYVFSTAGLLLLTMVFSYLVLVDNLNREDNQFLADKIHVLHTILLERPNKPESLEEEIKWEGASLRFIKYYARILDEKGQELIETPGMDNIIAASSFPPPIGTAPDKGKKLKSSEGKSYLLMTVWADVGRSGVEKRILQLALDISNEGALIVDYRRKLAIMLFFGILLSAGISIVIARRGIRPIEEIAKTAERITAAQLHERVGQRQWPKELTTLAGAFDKMLKRLEDSFIRLSQFSADLAHELRTPINSLRGEAEVGLSRARTADEYRRIIESSLEEYDRLAGMVDGLLFMARADNRDIKINLSHFDVIKEVKAVVEFYDAMAEEQGIEVICQGCALLNADQTLFRRTVGNLLSNALRYTPKGGKVTILAKQSDYDSVEIIIGDTGPGIAKEDLPRLFDRFYRADYARLQYPQGTGLGLSIVKSIMDVHSGTIHVQSKPMSGTTVTLKFPQMTEL